MPSSYAERLLAWFDDHGRQDLPWQHPQTPYRVWISEIMLQQTQVSVVIGYFQRFMERFPDIKTLSEAPTEDVLSLWAGLGYYARARNLHSAARVVATEFGGQMPATLEGLVSLPGIGRSTAGAILSMGYGQRAAILDGNVKRVLARHEGIAGWPGQSAVAKTLWAAAEARLPDQRFGDFTQASMDLGATLCTRHQPACLHCPVSRDCSARRTGRTLTLPTPKPKARRGHRTSYLWLIRDPQNRVLLERRPPTGVWGGLWSLPESDALECPIRLVDSPAPTEGTPLHHELSHFTWELKPVSVHGTVSLAVQDSDNRRWYPANALPGLPAPIRRLIELDQNT